MRVMICPPLDDWLLLIGHRMPELGTKEKRREAAPPRRFLARYRDLLDL